MVNEEILHGIRVRVAKENFRITRHAHEEMVEEGIRLDEVLEAVAEGEILENYPEHRRGSCCLINGTTRAGRSLHAVCTTGGRDACLITVYEPKPPRWENPSKRGKQG